ncbi:hypothetical protein D9M73_128640 [compost metagenome]|nr:MAG TPA: hypothetical protein [Caudoviricetes sp.]
MAYDPQLHRKVMLAHYTRLGALPGWKQYVWEQIRSMAKADPALYGDFPDLVTQALRHASASQSSPQPSSVTTKPAIPTTAPN